MFAKVPLQWIQARKQRLLKIRRRRSRRRFFLFSALGAAGIAALAYVFDPDRGRSRRVKIKDQVAGKTRRAARKAERAARFAAAEVEGKKQRLAHLDQGERTYDDATLANKVRSEVVGGEPFSGYGIKVMAENGTVILNGEVGTPDEINEIERKVAKLPGVWEVKNNLHLPKTEAPNKAGATKGNGSQRSS
jgi:hypothetical protein